MGGRGACRDLCAGGGGGGGAPDKTRRVVCGGEIGHARRVRRGREMRAICAISRSGLGPRAAGALPPLSAACTPPTKKNPKNPAPSLPPHAPYPLPAPPPYLPPPPPPPACSRRRDMGRRRRRARGLLSALHLRESGRLPDAAFRRAAHTALVPAATFANVAGVPPVSLRRFSLCGRFLIATARNHRDLVVFRLEAGGLRPAPPVPGLDFARPAVQPRRPPPALLRPLRPPPPSSRLDSPFVADLPPGLPSAPAPVPAHARPGLLATLPVPLRPAPTPPRPRRDFSSLHSCHFSRFFTSLHQTPVALGAEVLLRDFCLAAPRGAHVVLASYHPREADPHVPPAPPPTAPIPAEAAVPVLESFTLHLVHIETGAVVDRFTLLHDFVPLDGHAGVHMRGDMLCVLSLRHQVLHIIKIQESLGRLTEEAQIGSMCRPDDDFEIARATDAEAAYRRHVQHAQRQRMFGSPVPSEPVASSSTAPPPPAPRLPPHVAAETVRNPRNEEEQGPAERARSPQEPNRSPVERPPTETGLGGGKLRSGFYTGLMQRLLVYVYRKYLSEGNQSLFYRVVGQYSMLVMLKAQFLDEDHLLIKLGSHERQPNKTSHSGQTATCFFVVYCISTTKILNLFENRSTELLAIYEKYRDLFIGDPAVSATLLPTRSSSMEDSGEGPDSREGRNAAGDVTISLRGDDEGSGHDAGSEARVLSVRGPSGGGPSRERRPWSLKRTRAELAALPVSCQTGNMSVYLDRSVFSYNAERMSGLDGTRAVSLRDVNAVKFIGAQSGLLRFKLAPGMACFGGSGSRAEDATRPDVIAVQRKRRAVFLFHPTLPFVISTEVSVVLPPLYNFHVYGFRR